MDFASTAVLLLCIIIGGLLLTSWKVHQKRQLLPPGPTPLPLLGTLWKIKPHLLYETYLPLSKQYGPVFTIWIGTSPVVVLCGYDLVKDALVNHAEEFSGRAVAKSNVKVIGGFGIINSNGKKWQVLRRFAISTLRNFGMGKRSMEQRVQKESQHLLKSIDDKEGDAFDPMMPIQSAVANVICSTVFGERFSYKDHAFLQILQIVNLYFNFIRSVVGQLYNSMPTVMAFLPGPHHRIIQDAKSLRTFIEEKIELHKQTFDRESPRDFIDCFLMKDNTKEPEFSMGNLVATAFDLFLAGTETTTGSVQFSLLVMIKYPDIQEKVQQEIDEVVGPKRTPGIEDRVKMPYTSAVILEIQRFVDLVPMALPHSMTRDTAFHGYMIPQGTKVLPILTSVLHDPEQWENPEIFNPEHFLDENRALRRRAAYMPFSAGKRQCPGEELARMEIFLFLTALLQSFTFQSVTDPISLDLASMRRDFRRAGLSFQLRARRRHISTA